LGLGLPGFAAGEDRTGCEVGGRLIGVSMLEP
jgi:hypothetical protein